LATSIASSPRILAIALFEPPSISLVYLWDAFSANVANQVCSKHPFSIKAELSNQLSFPAELALAPNEQRRS
jgi:hypothetical protein